MILNLKMINSYMIIQKDSDLDKQYYRSLQQNDKKSISFILSYEKSVINIKIWRELYTEIVNRNSLKYLVYQSIEGTLIYR